MKTGLWPRQDDAIARPDQSDVGSSMMPIVTENNVSQSDLHKVLKPSNFFYYFFIFWFSLCSFPEPKWFK